MNFRTFPLMLFFICILTASCGIEEKLPVFKAEKYEEKIIEAELPLQLSLDCEICDLEIYRWIRKEVKFEYTESLSGEVTADKLDKKLKSFRTEIKNDENEIVFRSRFNGYENLSSKLTMKVFIPKKTKSLNILCKKGKLRIYDDIKGQLVISADKLDVEINRIEGKIDCSIKEGNFILADGKLLNGSSISTDRGNIRVKAQYEPSGIYNFTSKDGLLDIFIPDNLTAHFTEDLPIEFEGTDYYSNDYPEEGYDNPETGSNTVKFNLKSGLDMIRITRF